MILHFYIVVRILSLVANLYQIFYVSLILKLLGLCTIDNIASYLKCGCEVMMGWDVCCISLLFSSFFESVWHHICELKRFTQGLWISSWVFCHYEFANDVIAPNSDPNRAATCDCSRSRTLYIHTVRGSMPAYVCYTTASSCCQGRENTTITVNCLTRL